MSVRFDVNIVGAKDERVCRSDLQPDHALFKWKEGTACSKAAAANLQVEWKESVCAGETGRKESNKVRPTEKEPESKKFDQSECNTRSGNSLQHANGNMICRCICKCEWILYVGEKRHKPCPREYLSHPKPARALFTRSLIGALRRVFRKCKSRKSMSMPRSQRGAASRHLYPSTLLSLATHATPDVRLASPKEIREPALLAVHTPAEGLVHTPDVPVERSDLLDGALVAVDLDPLDERADDLLAGLAYAHLEG